MNERIKELAEQAGEYANESTKDFTGDEPVVWMDYYTEKFAELIVKECANHIMTSSDRHRKEYFADMVLKHFGVEE